MTESNERKIGVILSYVSLIATTIVQLIYTPFLIKMMGQSEYGLYSLVYSDIGYLTVLDLGFGNAIIIYTTKFRAQKKYNEEAYKVLKKERMKAKDILKKAFEKR